MLAIQILLALTSWLVFVIAPAGRLAYLDRGLPTTKRRGVSIFPGWPVLPMLLSAPALILGAEHALSIILAALHVAVLVGSLGYVGYWYYRLRNADRLGE